MTILGVLLVCFSHNPFILFYFIDVNGDKERLCPRIREKGLMRSFSKPIWPQSPLSAMQRAQSVQSFTFGWLANFPSATVTSAALLFSTVFTAFPYFPLLLYSTNQCYQPFSLSLSLSLSILGASHVGCTTSSPHFFLLLYILPTNANPFCLCFLYLSNRSYVLVVETCSKKINKHWLTGPLAGTTQLLLEGFPGYPDGLTRASTPGEFWVAIILPDAPILRLVNSGKWSIIVDSNF